MLLLLVTRILAHCNSGMWCNTVSVLLMSQIFPWVSLQDIALSVYGCEFKCKAFLVHLQDLICQKMWNWEHHTLNLRTQISICIIRYHSKEENDEFDFKGHRQNLDCSMHLWIPEVFPFFPFLPQFMTYSGYLMRSKESKMARKIISHPVILVHSLHLVDTQGVLKAFVLFSQQLCFPKTKQSK